MVSAKRNRRTRGKRVDEHDDGHSTAREESTARDKSKSEACVRAKVCLEKMHGYDRISEIGAANIFVCGWGAPELFSTPYGRALCLMMMMDMTTRGAVSEVKKSFTVYALENGLVQGIGVDDPKEAYDACYHAHEREVVTKAARLVSADKEFRSIPSTKGLCQMHTESARPGIAGVGKSVAIMASVTWCMVERCRIDCCMEMANIMGISDAALELQGAVARLSVISRQISKVVAEGVFPEVIARPR